MNKLYCKAKMQSCPELFPDLHECERNASKGAQLPDDLRTLFAHPRLFQKLFRRASRPCDIFPSGYVYICETPLKGGVSHGSCQGSGQPAGSNH